MLKARCRRPSYLKKLAKAEDLIDLFPHNSYIGWSGFTGVGYPKKVPTALADHVERNNLQGKLKYNLFVGASSGAETENRWARVSLSLPPHHPRLTHTVAQYGREESPASGWKGDRQGYQ